MLKMNKEMERTDTVLTKYPKEFCAEEKLSIHELILTFV